MRKQLEFQADRIEAVLTKHKVTARVTGGTVTPRWVRFKVLPALGAKISKIRKLDEELAAALGVDNCRVQRRGAAVDVEVARDDPRPVRLLSLYRQLERGDVALTEGIPPVTAILGLADDGAPLLIRLPSPDVAHILVSGTTGSGKTVLLKSIILSLAMVNAPRGLSMVLIDPKGSAFAAFDGLPHLARPVIRDGEETVEALQSLVRLMERRDSAGGSGGSADSSYQSSVQGGQKVVLVIDELADLLMTGGKEVQRPLTRLLQRGRGAGIHVVAATQKPTSSVLGSLTKANFPVRLVGKVTSATDARVASGWSGTGAERLEGRGDFIAVAEGRVMRFQAAYVAPEEVQKVVGQLADSGHGGEVLLSGEEDRRAYLEGPMERRKALSPGPQHRALPGAIDQLTEIFR